MKRLLLILMGIVSWPWMLQLSAQVSYQASYHAQAGNPGGLNQEDDFLTGGWDILVLGGQTQNQWSNPGILPFAFQYFGQSVNSFRVSANGVLTFSPVIGTPPGDNTSLPTTNLPNSSIACYWEAFTHFPPTSTNDFVQTRVFGTAPNRQFWIRWYSYEWGPANFVYVAIVLEESTNQIYIVDQYSSLTSNQITSTVGLQQHSGFAVQAGGSAQLPLETAGSDDLDNSYYQFVPYDIPPEDIVPAEIVGLESSACGTSPEGLTVRFVNQGQLPAASIQAGFALNNVVLAQETIPGPLAPGDTMTYTFTTPITYPGDGDHTLMVWGGTPSDVQKANDTMRTPLTRITHVSTFPYIADFDGGPEGWRAEGARSTWEWGTPIGSVIQGAATGLKAWATNLTGPHDPFEQSAVVSPCFDGTQLPTDSWLSIGLWWECESPWDGMGIQYTVDEGQSWQTLGSVHPEWYNSNFVASLPGGQALGWSGTGNEGAGSWQQLRTPLPAVCMTAPRLRFRVVFAANGAQEYDGVAFDHVVIGQAPQVNLGMDRYVCSGEMISGTTAQPGNIYHWSNGDTSPTLTIEYAGEGGIMDTTLILNVTNTLGLSRSDTVQIFVAAPIETELVAVTPVRCAGEASGAIDIAIQGGSAPFTIDWSNGQASEDIQDLGTGWYDAVLTDVHGCPGRVDSIEVREPDPLLIEGIVFHVTCWERTDGRIEVGGSGGNAPYEWAWNDSTQGANRDNLPAGSYEITLTDSLGCVHQQSFMITRPDSLYAVLDMRVDAQCPRSTDGELTVSAVGGTAPYEFHWNHGEVGDNLTGLLPGDYELAVLDAQGCMRLEGPFTVSHVDPLPEVNFGYTLTNNNLSLVDSSLHTDAYLWSFGDDATSEQVAPLHTYADTGSYTVTLVGANSCGNDTLERVVYVMALDTVPPPDTSITHIAVTTQGDWKVYPNPASEAINLSIADQGGKPLSSGMVLYNEAGQRVWIWNATRLGDTIVLPIPATLPNGIYWLQSADRSQPIRQRILIRR